ncbi:MAG: single-stranded DNA-binding protein [Bacteroidota bacterium]
MNANQVVLVGYVGQALKKSNSKYGALRVALRVATHTRRKTGIDQACSTNTVWHDVVAWNKTAGFAERNFVKGSRVLVEGSIEYRCYADASGHRRFLTRIKAHSLMNLDR